MPKDIQVSLHRLYYSLACTQYSNVAFSLAIGIMSLVLALSVYCCHIFVPLSLAHSCFLHIIVHQNITTPTHSHTPPEQAEQLERHPCVPQDASPVSANGHKVRWRSAMLCHRSRDIRQVLQDRGDAITRQRSQAQSAQVESVTSIYMVACSLN